MAGMRRVSVGRLIVRVRIDQRRLLVGHHFLDDGGDRLALGEPLPAIALDRLLGRRLVEGNEPRHPAIFEAEPV